MKTPEGSIVIENREEFNQLRADFESTFTKEERKKIARRLLDIDPDAHLMEAYLAIMSNKKVEERMFTMMRLLEEIRPVFDAAVKANYPFEVPNEFHGNLWESPLLHDDIIVIGETALFAIYMQDYHLARKLLWALVRSCPNDEIGAIIYLAYLLERMDDQEGLRTLSELRPHERSLYTAHLFGEKKRKGHLTRSELREAIEGNPIGYLFLCGDLELSKKTIEWVRENPLYRGREDSAEEACREVYAYRLVFGLPDGKPMPSFGRFGTTRPNSPSRLFDDARRIAMVAQLSGIVHMKVDFEGIEHRAQANKPANVVESTLFSFFGDRIKNKKGLRSIENAIEWGIEKGLLSREKGYLRTTYDGVLVAMMH